MTSSESQPRTSPPENETWEEMKARTGEAMPRHDGGCTCWPHVSERDAIHAIEAVALAEYRSKRVSIEAEAADTASAQPGSLDVERLAEAIHRGEHQVGLSIQECDHPRELWVEVAQEVAAEYTRLAAGEHSDAR